VGEVGETERPRRRAIEFYNRVYQIHQRMIALGDDTPIELVLGVGVARWQVEGRRINVPLIEQLIEIELEETGALVLRPRNLPPQLVLKAFHALELEGSKAAQRDIGEVLEKIVDDPDVGFSPFEKRSFEKVLRACAARLTPTGTYYPDTIAVPEDRSLPNADATLRITDTWVAYVRQRSGDFRRDDIARLIKRVEEVEEESELPPSAIRFVVEPSNETIDDPDLNVIDLGSRTLMLPEEEFRSKPPKPTTVANGTREQESNTFFFPLAYNDAQEEIIRRLEDKNSDGVVVQGPQGTGKTHTIANIICHFLATKRRVLVTAKTPEALTALQEKIPEGIRSLAISVIHNDREGARQLQDAVQALTDKVKAIDGKAVSEAILEKQARLAELRDRIRKIDGRLHALAEQNLAPVAYNGQEISAMELARVVVETRDRHRWFPDSLDLDPRCEPQFGDEDIEEAKKLRRLLLGDLDYDVETVPEPKSLPDLARVVAAHGELRRVTEIERAAQGGEFPYMNPDLDSARRLRDWVVAFDGFMREIVEQQWLLDLHHTLLGLKSLDQEPLARLKEMLAIWSDLHRRGRDFDLKGLACDQGDDQAFEKALDDLAAGRKPFGLFAMFKGGVKAKIDACWIEGRRPASAEDWGLVRSYRMWQCEGQRFIGRWQGIARAVNFPELAGEWDTAKRELLRVGRIVERLYGLHGDLDVYRAAIRNLFPYGIDADEVLHHGRCEKIIDALTANLEKVELAGAIKLRSDIESLLGESALPFYSAVREFSTQLGNSEVPQGAVVEAWQGIVCEARRLAGLKEAFCRLNEISAKVAASGAVNWARELRNSAPRHGEDLWTPTNWRSTWERARADGYLRSLGDRQIVTSLSEARAAAEAEQQRLFADVVRLRTFLGLKRSLTQKIVASLAKFTSAIAKLGKGTGKAAGRYRRIMRDAAMEAAQAVPCWILPEWRVAEQLPAELATFDLVIIDEASQSDITALPAIMRGKKVLIVGDDKQVSPTPVGIEDRKIVQLRTTFLSGLPFGDQMDPATSLYELGGMVFPGKAIILREHFRCVEPIIRFSSRFYKDSLIPLRLPKASERLDPPLVDIYVPHGRKKKEINEAEADVIVAEIAKMVADPAFETRSIGVISLIGNVQANLIYTRLLAELGAEVVEKHRIMCGNAATFQGQERDVVVLSMVACPATAVAQTSRMFEQRFNVASSRARDRLILVRSVSSSDLGNPEDLKLALIEHFRNPMKGGNIIKPKEVLDLCQSDFERDFGRCLLDLGYRLRPQVPVAGYSIDFVVEGADDRRLAIELDGDKYHGPDKWADDVRRQRALERLGWVFWRCWGSAWIADRAGCIADLKDTLLRLGIEPIGMGEIDGTFTAHVEVAPPKTIEKVLGVESDLLDGASGAISQSVMPLVSEIAVEAPNKDHPGAESSVFADLNGVTVDVGDLVFIRYNDQPERTFSIRLSDKINRPEDGIIHVQAPLGAAILGASLDEQVEVMIDAKKRTAVVEKIEKAREIETLAAE
jgi:very-short-patch-repair endonuclease